MGNSSPPPTLPQYELWQQCPRMQKSRYTQQYQQMLKTLRRVRKRAGFTQIEAAAAFDAHASFISKCETGERRIDVVELAEFCRLYGVSLADFLAEAELE